MSLRYIYPSYHKTAEPIVPSRFYSRPRLSELEKAFATLGLPVTASLDQVQKAYRARVQTIHPDRCLDPMQRLRHNQELARLNDAYKLLMAQLRIRMVSHPDTNRTNTYTVPGYVSSISSQTTHNPSVVVFRILLHSITILAFILFILFLAKARQHSAIRHWRSKEEMILHTDVAPPQTPPAAPPPYRHTHTHNPHTRTPDASFSSWFACSHRRLAGTTRPLCTQTLVGVWGPQRWA